MQPSQYLISYLLEPISFLLFLIVLIYYYRVINQSKIYLFMTAYYAVMIGLQLWGLFPKKTNTHIYHVSYLVTSLAFAYYFYHTLPTKTGKIAAIAAGALTHIYFLINVGIFGESLFDSIGYVITSMGITVLVFMYLYYLMSHVTEKPITADFSFWFISAQLVYHLGAFAIFLMFNYFTKRILTPELYIHENRAILVSLWGAHNVLLFLSSLLAVYGLIMVRKHNRSGTQP